MSDELLKLGQELLSMGHKIIETSGSKKNHEKEEKDDSDSKGKVLDLPNKALIVASLKRKIGE